MTPDADLWTGDDDRDAGNQKHRAMTREEFDRQVAEILEWAEARSTLYTKEKA